jgi:hypothetical protein
MSPRFLIEFVFFQLATLFHPDGAGLVRHDDYVVVHARLLRALIPTYSGDINEAAEVCACEECSSGCSPVSVFCCGQEDWKTDTAGRDGLDRNALFESLFMLVDLWTVSVSSEEYCAFVDALITRVQYPVSQTRAFRHVSDATFESGADFLGFSPQNPLPTRFWVVVPAHHKDVFVASPSRLRENRRKRHSLDLEGDRGVRQSEKQHVATKREYAETQNREREKTICSSGRQIQFLFCFLLTFLGCETTRTYFYEAE